MPLRRVVKVGGSLLELPDLAIRLRRWQSAQAPSQFIFIAGGGRLADAVRDYDAIHRLGAEQAHQLAVQAMSVTARLLAELIGERRVILDWQEAMCEMSDFMILDVANFLATIEPSIAGACIAHSWDTTSDSIAARVARVVGAEELVLLKSRLAPEASTMQAASAAGLVDACFPRVAASWNTVRVVNLREDAFAEQRLIASPE